MLGVILDDVCVWGEGVGAHVSPALGSRCYEPMLLKNVGLKPGAKESKSRQGPPS